MQKCNKCNDKFKYKIILKSIWKSYSPITCEGCGTLHYVNYLTRTYATLMFLPLVIRLFGHDIFWFTNTFGGFICYLFWIAAVTLVFPFIARYHSKMSSH